MVSIENLEFYYKKRRPLFRDLSLDLKPGNIYGLLGKNGAGKTTLLKILCGLLFPKDGKIDVLDTRPQSRVPLFLRETFLIPEELYLPELKPARYISLYASFYPRFDKKALLGYLEEFEVEMDRKLTALSYGQKKKFLLAFGLAANCKFLVMDEPTNGLDIPSKSQFRKLTASGLTDDRIFLISTHQVRDMENLIDPLIILKEGKIVAQADLFYIRDKLLFTFEKEDPGDRALYYEKTMGGYAAIRINEHTEESRIDLELLFNAITKKTQPMMEVLKGGIG